MLKKQLSYDHSITELGHIQVRQITRIIEDGKEISKTYHRHVVSPGDAVGNEDERTKAIAGVVHTPTVIATFATIVKKNKDNNV